jgi:predicted DNA-binding transcriptional regulator YafY
MELRNRLQRLFLIIEKLRTSGYATFQDINTYIQRGFEIRDGEKDITIRTFQRDIKDINELFHIEIKCNRSNQYFIAEDEHSSLKNKMLEAFDIFNLLNIGEQISPHVIFDNHCKLGTQHLFGLLHAIKNGLVVKFIHKSNYKNEPTNREAEPYALKEFKGRWYLLAKDYKGNFLKTFGIDRILELDITKKKFAIPANFNVNNYFEHCYGIIAPDDSEFEPEEIILSFPPEQGKYVTSYPLHESQKTILENDKEIRISLYLFVTYDLRMEILSYGDKVKVIQPQSLIDDLKQIYKSAQKQY